jgi:hypothetical protein
MYIRRQKSNEVADRGHVTLDRYSMMTDPVARLKMH